MDLRHVNLQVLRAAPDDRLLLGGEAVNRADDGARAGARRRQRAGEGDAPRHKSLDGALERLRDEADGTSLDDLRKLNESVKINMLLDKGRQKYVTPLHPLQLPDAAAAAAAAAGAAADECEPHRPSSRLVPHRVERLGGRGRGRGRLVCLR